MYASIKRFKQAAVVDLVLNVASYFRRKQAGVYASYTYGPMGKDVKVLTK